VIEAAEISESYINALRLFAERDAVAARRALAELERRVIAQSPTRHWSKLRESELAVARTLVKAEPASVMTLILVHREMFSWYRTRHEPKLSEYSWTQAAAIADGVSTIPGWKPPEGFVECVLLDLAGDLVRQGDVRRAQVLLERAVRLAPSEQATRFALAVVLELSGQWYEAARNLQALVEEHPAHYEGRLRLAVNRYRLGSARAAERLLRQLVAEAAPEWIVTLGYQELAQLMVDEGRNDEAVLLLREAIFRLPRNQRLRIQLAHALDTAQHPSEAAELVKALEVAGAQLETSPRVRYAEWPEFETEGVCGNLEQARRDGLEALTRALR
jgi:predicted Zn-dependent protease